MKKNLLFLFTFNLFILQLQGVEAFVKAINKPGGTNFVHAPSIVEVGPGVLLAAFYAGSQFQSPDTKIYASRYENEQWSEAVAVASSDEITTNLPSAISKQPGETPCWDPTLCNVNGALFLFYKIGESPYSWTGALKRSYDGGKTWSKPELLARHGVVGPHKNKPLLLPDGSLVCPSARSSWQSWTGYVDILKHAGAANEAWQAVGPLTYDDPASGILQPTIFTDRENNLRMLFRTKNVPFLCTATSCDGGVTWSKVEPTAVQSNDSCCDAVTLRDKRVLLVYNDLPAGQRYKLDLAISGDGGTTWQNIVVLEECDDHKKNVCFPAIIQASDDVVHVLYVYNNESITHVMIKS